MKHCLRWGGTDALSIRALLRRASDHSSGEGSGSVDAGPAAAAVALSSERDEAVSKLIEDAKRESD